jgi:hypothetical protein
MRCAIHRSNTQIVIETLARILHTLNIRRSMMSMQICYVAA